MEMEIKEDKLQQNEAGRQFSLWHALHNGQILPRVFARQPYITRLQLGPEANFITNINKIPYLQGVSWSSWSPPAWWSSPRSWSGEDGGWRGASQADICSERHCARAVWQVLHMDNQCSSMALMCLYLLLWILSISTDYSDYNHYTMIESMSQLLREWTSEGDSTIRLINNT